MREVEFRAWLKNSKKMVEIEEIHFIGQKQIAYDEIEYRYTDKDPFHYTQWVDFDEIELMQHIGLKDKNGVKIFEGDIVKDEKQRLFVIEYKFGGFNLAPLIYFNDEFSWNPLGDMQTAGFLNESCEVIGNIYENKELLRVDSNDLQ